MGAVASIVLADALATPVNHTFIPLNSDANGVWWFEDQTGGDAVGYQRISISLTRPPIAAPGQSSANRVAKVKLAVLQPRLETMGNNAGGYTPPPTVAYVERTSCEFLIPERATAQDRKDARKYMLGLLANTQVVAAIESLQSIY